MLALSAALLSLLASSFAAPQNYGSGGSPNTQTIIVGGANGELTFSPEAIFAKVGDVVTFEFHQKNHSVVQSSFANPCGKLDGGLNTGYMPVADGVTSGFPTYQYTVQDDSKPLWFYCSQGAGAHCHAGMVFSINCPPPPAANSFDNFKAAAMAQGSGYAAAPAATTAAPDAAAPDTTTYPGVTVPPAPAGTEVTSTVELGSSTWTTTYTSYPNSPDPTPNSLEGNVIKVTVGANGQFAYEPSRVDAKPRDIIRFEFHQKNHTATQSSFAAPCRKLQFTSPTGQVGIDSGFMPVPADATTFPTYDVVVNDTAPMWFYCRQTAHCGMGMVFAVNSDESSARSFSAFQTLAKEINGTAASGSSGSAGGASPADTTTGGAARFSANVVLGVASVALGALLL